MCSKFNSNYHFSQTLTKKQLIKIKMKNFIVAIQLNNDAAAMKNYFIDTV